jgi:hypothetical protein
MSCATLQDLGERRPIPIRLRPHGFQYVRSLDTNTDSIECLYRPYTDAVCPHASNISESIYTLSWLVVARQKISEASILAPATGSQAPANWHVWHCRPRAAPFTRNLQVSHQPIRRLDILSRLDRLGRLGRLGRLRGLSSLPSTQQRTISGCPI